MGRGKHLVSCGQLHCGLYGRMSASSKAGVAAAESRSGRGAQMISCGQELCSCAPLDAVSLCLAACMGMSKLVSILKRGREIV